VDVATTAVVLSVGVIVLLVALMALGWRNRVRRQQEVPAPAGPPGDPGGPLYAAEGQYVVTTSGGDWLDRVTAHGLGNKATATAAVYPHGLLFDRSGAGEVYIPRKNLTGVRLERGIAGKFVEKDGLIVVSWTQDAHSFDTGFRTRYAADKTPLLSSISALIEDTDPLIHPTGKEVQ
jgi:hypothetical protein